MSLKKKDFCSEYEHCFVLFLKNEPRKKGRNELITLEEEDRFVLKK